jgi:putative ABC transport system permease protein
MMLWSDVRHAVRSLRRARGFTTVAVGTLAASLALAVAVMAVVNAYLLRGLPYPESDRLFNVRYALPGHDFPQGLAALDWRALDDLVEHPIAWDLDNFSLRGEPYPELAAGTWATPGYMAGFGVRPALGRGFGPRDYEEGQPLVAIISHRLWQTRFGGTPDVLGRQFDAHVNDRPEELERFTIIGVLAAGQWHMNAFTEVLAPLKAPTFPYLVRLREGLNPALAANRITAMVRRANPGLPPEWRADLLSTHTEYLGQVRPLLLSLAAATVLVLLIGCANVAVLLTARASQRRREFAVRKALGATAGRVTRTVMAEAMVLGLAATALGLGAALLIVDAAAPVIDSQLGRAAPGGASAIAIDGTILLAGLAAGLLATCACSLVAVWASGRTPVSLALTGGQKSATDGPAHGRARATLIAVEVAASLALMVGAALMVQSGLRILDVDMGLDVDGVSVARISLRQRAYPDVASQQAFYEQARQRIAALPGVAAIAFTNWWPLQAAPPREVSAATPGRPPATRAGVSSVSADYFPALGIALRDGRVFTRDDRAGAPDAAVVSATLARTLWPDRRAVGERLQIAPPAGTTEAPRSFLVVGVVADVRHSHTDTELADVYLALAQAPAPAVFAYLRASPELKSPELKSPELKFGPTYGESQLRRNFSSGIERDIRDAVAAIDPDLALGTPRPLAEILDQQRAAPRLLASLLVVFAVLAMMLSLVGIYGVIAYAVRQREREIAIRMAVGAAGRDVLAMFLRQGAVVLACGLALGVVAAVGLGRVLETQLFGVRPAEPAVLAAMTMAFAMCGIAAVAWPARAAAGMDPAAALKE